MSGASLIGIERARQRRKGYNANHDSSRQPGELAMTAVLILDGTTMPTTDQDHWSVRLAKHVRKKYAKDAVRRLTIAGAMIAAEIDRLQSEARSERK